MFFMKKRILAGVFAAIMLAGSLAGCGNKADKTNADGDQINLRFSFWEPSTGKETETTLQGIVDAYRVDHPNVNIELISQANTGYQDWIKAQMAVDSLPEIQMNGAGNLIEMGKNGVVENIEDAFNSPNPYYDNQIWKDTFAEGSLDNVHEYRVSNSYNIPLFGTGIAMYYNVDMYKELGLEIPKDWNEFIANCEVIKNAGETPIAYMGQKKDQTSWLLYELTGDLFAERWLDIDNLNYNNDYHITHQEMAKALLEGDFNIAEDKAFQEDFKTLVEYMKKHIAYAPNAFGYDEAAAKTLFLSGKAGHLNTGSWDIVGLLNNEEIPFEVGVFKYPKLTKENSEYAGVGISNNCYQSIAISSTVNKQEGAREAAIDFVMFLTSPEQYKVFIEGTKQIPCINGVDAGPVYEAFMEKGGYPLLQTFRYGDSNVGINPSDVFNDVVAGKEVTMDDKFFADVQESMVSWAKTYAEKQKLSAENNYNLDAMPIVRGTRD